MGFWDSISSGISGAVGAISGAISSTWEGVNDAWSDTGPSSAGPGGGWARRIGTQIGDIAERTYGGFIAQAPGMILDAGGTVGGTTGSGPVGGGRSIESILRGYEKDAARREAGAVVYRDTGPTAPTGAGLSRESPADQPLTGYSYQPRPDQIVGAGLPAVIAGSAVGDVLARGAEYAVSPEGREMIGGLWDLVRGRTALPGGAPIVDAIAPETGYPTVGEFASQYAERQGPMLPSTISAPLPFGGTLFKQTYSGVRANSIVMVRNPVTGSPTFFRHVGKPILFSGDFATARRVDRIAKKAKKSRRGR